MVVVVEEVSKQQDEQKALFVYPDESYQHLQLTQLSLYPTTVLNPTLTTLFHTHREKEKCIVYE